MKKKGLVVIPLALTLLISLTACENTQSKATNSQTKTEHQQTNKKKSNEKKKNQTSTKDNQDNSANVTNQNNQNQTTDAATTTQNDDTNNATTSNQANGNNSATNQDSDTNNDSNQNPSQDSQQQNGTGTVINTSEAAVNVLKNAFGNNPDYMYDVMSTDNGVYEIKMSSKLLRSQGGSGTIGLYNVMPDGSYSLK
ncbi:hypothetical protein M3M39_01515 [Fructilactobacillus hinvesii]|uniref:Lipoprotein n=1 Tax=Fructilactobacillus hinvesii TaxID=2940300 RepID=A0ABY5BUS1_9LACO|nr:hypothetical protein [Fructilactobacillus hinvesii]USS88187.1 hypothetical protein M3M39_01515 [Fructilactobacillus hinvesii]